MVQRGKMSGVCTMLGFVHVDQWNREHLRVSNTSPNEINGHVSQDWVPQPGGVATESEVVIVAVVGQGRNAQSSGFAAEVEQNMRFWAMQQCFWTCTKHRNNRCIEDPIRKEFWQLVNWGLFRGSRKEDHKCGHNKEEN